MNNKLKFMLIFMSSCLLFGCTPSSNPSVSLPSLSEEPTTEPTSEDPTTDPSIIKQEEFKIKNITCKDIRPNTIGLYIEEDSDTEEYYTGFISETYSVENVLLTQFTGSTILKYTIEFEGIYDVEEIEISLEHHIDEAVTIIYDTNPNKVVTIDGKGSFPTKVIDNKIVFYFVNNKDLLPGIYHFGAGFYQHLTVTQVKYNNEWIPVTENNYFVVYSHSYEAVGYDVIKNTDKEVIISFENYDYRDDLWLDKGTQIDSYSYLFDKEEIVTLTFKYKTSKKYFYKEFEVVRKIQIEFCSFTFIENKPCVEYVENSYGDFHVLNAILTGTFDTDHILLLIDGKRWTFFLFKGRYRGSNYTLDYQSVFIEKQFESILFIFEDYQIDLTEAVRSSV